jgi:hypothetical protein
MPYKDMVLEDLLKGIAKVSEGNIEISSDYDSSAIYKASNFLNEIQGYDLSNTQDIEKYQKLTGFDTKTRILEYTQLQKDSTQRAIESYLGEYAKKHFKSLLGEIDERYLADLVLDIVPESPMPREEKDSDNYNHTRGLIYNAKETFKSLRENPEKAIREDIERQSELLKPFLAANSSKLLQIIQEENNQRFYGTLIKYGGASKFLETTHNYLGRLSKEYEKKKGELNEDITKKIESYDEFLSTEERARLLSNESERSSELDKKYKDIGNLQEITGKVLAITIGTIKAKEEREEEEA